MKISVRELIIIYKGALLAIIPWLEKVKIKWREGEGYDDWDNICNVLYENIICSSLEEEISTNYSLAKYDFEHDNYLSLDFIEVESKNHFDKKLTFISFCSKIETFDSVKVASLDSSFNVIEYMNLNIEGLDFKYVKTVNGERITNTHVNIPA